MLRHFNRIFYIFCTLKINMKEIADQEARDFLHQCELVKRSLEKRRNFEEKNNLYPYILVFISIIIFLVLSTPLHPKSLVISAFEFYADSTKIRSLTNLLAGFSIDNSTIPWLGPGWFIVLIGMLVSSWILGFPILLPIFLAAPSLILTDLLVWNLQKNKKMKERKLIDSLEKSKKNNVYLPIFVLLLPVIGFTIAARAGFSAGALYFVMGFFVVFYLLIIMFISILTYVFLIGVKVSFFRRRFLDEYIICLLADCIEDVTDEGRWRFTQSRRSIRSKLEAIADVFQKGILNQAGVQDPEIRKNFRLIAGRFRSLNQWLFTPKKDTRSMLREELLFLLKRYLDFDLDAIIPRYEVDVSRRNPIGIASHIAFFGLRMLVPILLIFLFLRTPIAPEGPLRDYLVIGVFSLTGFRLLLAIDPGFGEALGSVLKLANQAKDTIR